MDQGLGTKILELRNNKHSYNEISKLLSCSKSLVSYHCTKNNLQNIGLYKLKVDDNIIDSIKLYYLSHTIEETSINFNISKSTVKRYVDIKRVKLTDEESKIQKRNHLKNKRQIHKIKAIEYKGGHCEKCGYDKSIWALDFHHTNPNEKEFKISKITRCNWNKIKYELDKCILLCRNCHAELHENEYKLKNN